MTDFLAVYFLLQLAVVFMVISLIWRLWPFYIASGFSWGITALYSLIISHGGYNYIWAFSLFCLAMSVLMFWAYWWIPRVGMKKGEYSPFSTFEDWANKGDRNKHDKMWGKTTTAMSKEKEDELEKEARRKRGDWVND